MILVADSGSTKTDWLAVDSLGNILHSFHGKGINPMVQDAEQIAAHLSDQEPLQRIGNDISKVYFYGAGCSEPTRNSMVETAIRKVTPNADIHIGHDLTGAVLALCGDQPGFACILGTGSNAVLFDGAKEIKQVPSLGWALGDEASGAWFGKRLVRDYLYLQLPDNIRIYLQDELKVDKESVLRAVYKLPDPNRYLAGFMPLLSTFRRETYVQSLLEEGFGDFIKFQLCCYENYNQYPANFVGSVALHFREELEDCCTNFGIETGKFIQRPIEHIAAYLIKKRQV